MSNPIGAEGDPQNARELYVPSFQPVESYVFRKDGLGYGNGPVNVGNRLKDSNDPLSPQIMYRVHSELESPDLLLPVGRDENDGTLVDDDGCGDGRAMEASVSFNDLGQSEQRYKFHRLREKLFGAGLVTAAVGIIANRMGDGDLNNVFERAHEQLKMARLSYGGHADCGATIYFPVILQNTIAYKEYIRADILAMAGGSEAKAETDAVLDLVFNNNQRYLDAQGRTFKKYDHEAVTQSIEARSKTVTQPGTNHKEVGFGINLDVVGKSIDQARIRHATGDIAQLFTMDVPRLTRVSQRSYDDVYQKKIAFVGGLAYAFSTLATLTQGDLRTVFRYVNSRHFDLPNLFAEETKGKNDPDTIEFAALELNSES